MELCECAGFVLWYLDDQALPLLPVCMCGHPDSEHLNKTGSCTGVLVRIGRLNRAEWRKTPVNTVDREMIVEAAELLGHTPPFQPGTVALEQWTQRVGAWMQRALALRMVTSDQVTRPVYGPDHTGVAAWPGATNTVPSQRPTDPRWRPIDPAGNVAPDPAPESPDEPDEGETGPQEQQL